MIDPNDRPVLPSQVVAERSHLVIPSMPHWIEPTVDFLCQKAVLGGACQETRSGKLMIALHEAITNAVVHGNLEVASDLKEQGNNAFAEALAQRSSDSTYASRTVDIVIDYDGEVCRWIITDQGRGFDVGRVLARCLSDDPEELLASGRGILMMKSFLDNVGYEMGGRRAILSLSRTSGNEKRKDSRVPLMTPFKVTPVQTDGTPCWTETYEAVSRNLSEHGIALLQQQLAHSGKLLIGITTDKGIVHIPAEVKHSRMLGANGMELGCQFEELAQPGDPLPPPPAAAPQLVEVQDAVTEILDNHRSRELQPDERRSHPRVVYNERVMIFLDERSDPIIAYARDLSKGGVSFIAQEPLSAEVTLSFAPNTERQTLKVRCKVVRCNRIQEGFYDIGAAFMRVDHKINT